MARTKPNSPPVAAGQTPLRSKRRRWFWIGAKWGAVLAVWALAVCLCIGLWIAAGLPDTSGLGTSVRQPSVTLRAADGSLIATFGDLYGEPLKLRDLPKALPMAVIATEDRRFYNHFGIDPIGILRALAVDLLAGRLVQGGSTLTQQLAKNLFLTSDRTLKRKLQEALLALELERRFSKTEILEIYLNRVYFGAGTYGVDAAARRYFGKSARRLDLYECATLAGLLKGPSRYSPAGNQQRAIRRTGQVLANMVDAGLLSAADAEIAARQSPELGKVPITRAGLRYFADWVQDQAEGAGYSGDVVVITTLDARMQAAAEATLTQILARSGAKMAAGQAALVAMSPDGAVRAMVGGRDYQESQFNRATQAARQPGSAFKPFVYLAALEHGVRPEDTLIDGPIKIGHWQPHNYSGSYQGEVSVAEGLAQSINTVAVQLGQKAGMGNVIAVAHRLGISADLDPDPSLALGAGEVTLLDLTTAYCAFASGGIAALPYGITEIRNSAGKLLFQHQGSGPGRVIQPPYANDMTRMLEGVISHGTGRAAQIGRPAAGKTGTTSDFRDALFVGYTSDLVTGIWFGNDDDSPMRHVSGGSLPARAWHDFMAAAMKDRPIRALPLAEPAAAEATDNEEFARLLEHAQQGPSTQAQP